MGYNYYWFIDDVVHWCCSCTCLAASRRVVADGWRPDIRVATGDLLAHYVHPVGICLYYTLKDHASLIPSDLKPHFFLLGLCRRSTTACLGTYDTYARSRITMAKSIGILCVLLALLGAQATTPLCGYCDAARPD
jgi:hypothetical protein